MLTTFIIANCVALAAVLAFARFDSRLVDEAGQPLARNGEWRERVIPASVEAEAPSLV